MNEKKRKFNLFKFIKGLFYFMCIITMFASLMRKAKADNVSTYTDLDNLFLSISYHDTVFDSYYEQAKSECPYFYTVEFTWRDFHVVQIFFSEYDGLSFSTYQMYSMNAYFTFGGNFMYLHNIDSVPTDSKVYVISGMTNSSDHSVLKVSTTGDRKIYSNGFYGYTGYCYNYNRVILYGSGIYMENCPNPTFRYVKGEFNFFYNYSNHILESNFLTYSTDNRFKIGTYKTAFGTSILGINLDDYITHYGQYESSYLSNLTLTLEYTQGLTVTQQTYSFSNQSPEYHYVNSSGKMALSILYYTFDGYDSDTDTFPDYDNVKIVSADLSIGYTLQLNVTGVDDYYVSLNYSLYVGHSYDTNVPQVVTPQTIVFNQVIDGNDWSVSSGIVSQGSTPVIPSWSNNCRVLIDTTVTNTTVDAPVGIIYNYYITYSDIENYRIFSYNDNDGYIEVMDYANIATFFANYLLDKTPTFYDVIVIDFGTSNSSLWDTETEYVFYTNNYWLRQSIYGLSNLQYAVQSCGYYTSSLYDFMTSIMGTLNNNMVSYFTTSTSNQNSIIGRLSDIGLTLDGFNSSFESYSSSMVGYASSILSAINGITIPTIPTPTDYSEVLDTISGQIDDVIEAINNLEFDVGDIDLSVNWTDMTVALGGDLVYLFKPTYNDIDDRFEDYLDSIGILAVPFNFVSGIYDTMADEGWSENLEITVPQIKVMGHILLERTDYSINPYIYFNYIGDDADVRDEKINTGMFQMIIMYIAILGASWFTYCHIFRRESEINEE